MVRFSTGTMALWLGNPSSFLRQLADLHLENSTGGPHIGPGMAWPMSLIVRIITTDDDDEIIATLRQLVESTDGLGLMHESINTFSATMYTRPWYVFRFPNCAPTG